MIRHPLRPGFKPDPSLCHVGDDFDIASPTFEWYPGVQTHHSRDLVNWRLVAPGQPAGPLRDASGPAPHCLCHVG